MVALIYLCFNPDCMAQQYDRQPFVFIDRCTNSTVYPDYQIIHVSNGLNAPQELSQLKNLSVESREILMIESEIERNEWICPVSWNIFQDSTSTDTLYFDKIILSFGAELHSQRQEFTICGSKIESDTLETFNGKVKYIEKVDGGGTNISVLENNALLEFISYDPRFRETVQVSYDPFYKQFIRSIYKHKNNGHIWVKFVAMDGRTLAKEKIK